jgi:hypothetical protein
VQVRHSETKHLQLPPLQPRLLLVLFTSFLQELTAAGPSAASVSSKLAWYVASQRPLFAAQDMQQLLKANRQAAAAAAVQEGGVLYVGQELYVIIIISSSSSGGRSSSSDHDTSNSLLSVVGPDGGPTLLMHSLADAEADAADSSSSSDSDADLDAFADAYAQEQPAASRRMLLDTASSSSSSSSSSGQTTLYNIPGISGGAGNDQIWSSVSELADQQREAAAGAAAAAAVPVVAGQVPRQQDFRIIGGAEAPRDRCGTARDCAACC